MLYTPPVYSINFFFSHLGVEDGLSQVSVLDIFQDSDGYIWFGTRNGANRYDGYEFVVYQNEVNNNATLTRQLHSRDLPRTTGRIFGSQLRTGSTVSIIKPKR
ncbi:MAG: two-component regulator propeller domain-containing protein [Parabacteroides merdae]